MGYEKNMDEIEYIVEQEDAGKRLDVYLNEKVDGFSRTYMHKLIEDNLVTVNNKQAKPKQKLNTNDVVYIEIPEPVVLDLVAEKIELDIVFEDQYLVVINKPQGMVVHPAHGNFTGTIVNALLYHCGSESEYSGLTGINGVLRPGIVHRIDKDTSGVIVVAKTNEAHLSLSEQFKEHTITRKYIALVEGKIKTDSGMIETLLGRNPHDRKKMAVVKDGKRAVTRFTVLQKYEANTLVEAVLETGRTHQIRVHMAYIGHPVVGDTVYGYKKQKFETNGQLLHAKVLGFNHPISGQYLEFSVPLPDYFEKVLKTLETKRI